MALLHAFRIVRVYDSKRKEHISVRVDMAIDLDSIAQALGHKAMRNKSRRSKVAIGITAEAREV